MFFFASSAIWPQGCASVSVVEVELVGTGTNITFWFIVLVYIINGIMSPKEMITTFLKVNYFGKVLQIFCP